MDHFKVLLVDDEGELVSTLVERLGYRGISAKYATSGSEALRMMSEEAFDVIVLDLKMPGMSGKDVLASMKRQHIDIPVLLITGHGSVINEREERPDGAFDYLAKPINLQDLVAKMREAIGSKNAE